MTTARTAHGRQRRNVQFVRHLPPVTVSVSKLSNGITLHAAGSNLAITFVGGCAAGAGGCGHEQRCQNGNRNLAGA
jgi:hypothetical protein